MHSLRVWGGEDRRALPAGVPWGVGVHSLRVCPGDMQYLGCMGAQSVVVSCPGHASLVCFLGIWRHGGTGMVRWSLVGRHCPEGQGRMGVLL